MLIKPGMPKGGRQKNFSEPSEGMDAEASLHGCIYGVF